MDSITTRDELRVIYDVDRLLVHFDAGDAMSSVRLAQLVRLMVYARQTGRRVAIEGLNPLGHEILRLTGLARRIEITPPPN